MMKRAFLIALAISLLPPAVGCTGIDSAASCNEASGFTLWQLPPQTHTQMMSYVMRTAGGKVIVIDGGMSGDAPYLRGFLGALGNRVQAWFITHPHPDHVDALTAILHDPGRLQISTIYGSMPTESWIAEHEETYLETAQAFNEVLRDSGLQLQELSPGQVMLIDKVRIETLGVKNPEITDNAINNSSVVLRVADARKSVLFTGDLGGEGGQKLLRGPYGGRVRADYVQMAHHGQAGVDRAFYEAVQPRGCLWPTPGWLWENDSGGGKGSGPWETLKVRRWMEELGIREHYVAADGLFRID